MSLFVLDTDTLSLLQHGHRAVATRVLVQAPGDVVIAPITVLEQVQGFQALLSRARSPRQIANAFELLVTGLLPT